MAGDEIPIGPSVTRCSHVHLILAKQSYTLVQNRRARQVNDIEGRKLTCGIRESGSQKRSNKLQQFKFYSAPSGVECRRFEKSLRRAT
jgi:hypothetical protein